jgi:hypothetical protein
LIQCCRKPIILWGSTLGEEISLLENTQSFLVFHNTQVTPANKKIRALRCAPLPLGGWGISEKNSTNDVGLDVHPSTSLTQLQVNWEVGHLKNKWSRSSITLQSLHSYGPSHFLFFSCTAVWSLSW